MVNFLERSAGDIARKAEEILSQPELIERAVKNEAAAVISNRVAKRFFDDVYGLIYSKEDLERRPFLNIGPGSFRHGNWRTADKKYGEENAAWTEMRRGIKQPPVDYYWDVYTGEPIGEADGFFKVVYTSHVIEHLYQQDVEFLLSEVRRVLEPGGVIRIVCPDAEQMANAYRNHDWGFFMHYLIAKTRRCGTPLGRLSQAQLKEMAADFVVEWTSLLTHKENPVTFSKSECVKFLDRYANLEDAFDEASRLSSRELNRSAGGHVNWFSSDKLERMLRDAGFSAVLKSGYLKSPTPILRDSRYFDRTDPEMSIFIEAVR